MRVAVDAMGGDHAPGVVVEGAVAAARQSGIGVTLVGPTARLRAELARQPDASQLDIRLVESGEAVGMGESPAQALRRNPSASIKVAADLVARGDAAALFSAGSTGATVLAACTAFGLLKGAERPALAVTVPTERGTAVLLDVGANADCKPRHLVAFAVMGSVFARLALDVPSPGVGLLSIGEEATKGNELTREAHQLLKATAVRFIGNIEARDVYSGAADVVVCDGFTGNVALKMSEGMVAMIEALMRRECLDAPAGQPDDRMLQAAFERLRHRVDYAESGGAPLLGVSGACIVGHGRSSVQAVHRAIVMAERFAARQLAGRLEQELMVLQGLAT